MAEQLKVGDRVRLIKRLTWDGNSGGGVTEPTQGVGSTGVVTRVYDSKAIINWDDNPVSPHGLGCDITCIEIVQPDLPPSLDRDAVEAWLNT